MIITPILTLSAYALFNHPQTFEKARAEAAKATGVDRLATTLAFKGSQRIHGSNQPFVLTISRDFQFRAEAAGSMPEIFGYDGKVGWQLNSSGVPHTVAGSDVDLARLDYYVLTGLWAVKDSPVEIDSWTGSDVNIRVRGTQTTAKLVVDTKTKLPTSLSNWGPSGSQTWTYTNFQNIGGIKLPTVSKMDSGDNHEKIEIQSGSVTQPKAEDFAVPAPNAKLFEYDSKTAPDVEVMRKFGYLFIHPLVDGKDEGWFFLDTGAEVMVLDPDIAKSHQMTVVGQESVSGVVASVGADFFRGTDFKLGPATIKNPTYMSLDMKEFSKILGIKLAGICGYDFISQVDLDIDPAKSTIGVFSPSGAKLPDGATWTPFEFHGSIPSLYCEFEGRRLGTFTLDTGSGSTVDFFSPSVSKYQLLKDRKTIAGRTGGAGGSAVSQSGTIEYFQFGPKRFDKPNVVFQTTDKGGFASPYRDGNIGMGFMGKFRMVVNYRQNRIAFIEGK